MVFTFIFSFGRFNLTWLTLEKREEDLKKTGLTYTKAVENSGYKKTIVDIGIELNYINKALFIAKAYYAKY